MAGYRHGSFCNWAAAGQPPNLLASPPPGLLGREGLWWCLTEASESVAAGGPQVAICPDQRAGAAGLFRVFVGFSGELDRAHCRGAFGIDQDHFAEVAALAVQRRENRDLVAPLADRDGGDVDRT